MPPKPIKLIASLATAGLLVAGFGWSGAVGATVKKASGTPIVVGQINPTTGAQLGLPEQAKALAASVRALNNAGGINGHPLKLIQCDSQNDTQAEVNCANTLVNDHVVATLGDNTFANPVEVQKILTAAGIPRIGINQLSTAEYAAKTNFDFTGGAIFILVGMMDALINKGDKKISVVIPDTPTAQQTNQLLDPIAAAQGAKVVNYVLVSTASGDYSQYVTQATENGAQGMVLATASAQSIQMAETMNQLNPKIDVVSGIAGYSLNQLKTMGAFAKKALWVWWEPGIDDVKDFPGLKEPIAQLSANMKGANVKNMSTTDLLEWLIVHAFSQVMKTQTGTPTAASVLAAFQAAKDIPMNGIVKPWTPTDYQSAGAFSSIITNVSNPWMYRIKYTGSATRTSTKTLFNTFVGLPGT